MEKVKKIKICLGLIYLVVISLILLVFFNNFSLSEVSSYEFIKNNRDYLMELKNSNYLLISVLFLIFTIIWVFFLGFGTPIFLLGGFIFGKWVGTIIVTFGLSIGATLLYIFVNYFFKDFVEENFSKRFSSLNQKFKKNEFLFFLIYRFVGGIPFALSNILPTLFNVKIKNFFFGSLIGMAPVLFVGATLGSGIEKIINENQEVPHIKDVITSSEIYIPFVAFFCLLFLGIVFRKYFFKK